MNIESVLIGFNEFSPLRHPIYDNDTEICLITKDPALEYDEKIKENNVGFVKEVRIAAMLIIYGMR